MRTFEFKSGTGVIGCQCPFDSEVRSKVAANARRLRHRDTSGKHFLNAGSNGPRARILRPPVSRAPWRIGRQKKVRNTMAKIRLWLTLGATLALAFIAGSGNA